MKIFLQNTSVVPFVKASYTSLFYDRPGAAGLQLACLHRKESSAANARYAVLCRECRAPRSQTVLTHLDRTGRRDGRIAMRRIAAE